MVALIRIKDVDFGELRAGSRFDIELRASIFNDFQNGLLVKVAEEGPNHVSTLHPMAELLFKLGVSVRDENFLHLLVVKAIVVDK